MEEDIKDVNVESSSLEEPSNNGKFCLERIKAVGVLVLFRASFQAL